MSTPTPEPSRTPTAQDREREAKIREVLYSTTDEEIMRWADAIRATPYEDSATMFAEDPSVMDVLIEDAKRSRAREAAARAEGVAEGRAAERERCLRIVLGDMKGMVLTHANVLDLAAAIRAAGDDGGAR